MHLSLSTTELSALPRKKTFYNAITPTDLVIKGNKNIIINDDNINHMTKKEPDAS